MPLGKPPSYDSPAAFAAISIYSWSAVNFFQERFLLKCVGGGGAE
jgi:hypothetical protein